MLCGYEACCTASIHFMHQYIHSSCIGQSTHSPRPMSERVKGKMFKMANAAAGDGVTFLFLLVPVLGGFLVLQ